MVTPTWIASKQKVHNLHQSTTALCLCYWVRETGAVSVRRPFIFTQTFLHLICYPKDQKAKKLRRPLAKHASRRQT